MRIKHELFPENWVKAIIKMSRDVQVSHGLTQNQRRQIRNVFLTRDFKEILERIKNATRSEDEFNEEAVNFVTESIQDFLLVCELGIEKLNSIHQEIDKIVKALDDN